MAISHITATSATEFVVYTDDFGSYTFAYDPETGELFDVDTYADGPPIFTAPTFGEALAYIVNVNIEEGELA